MSISSRAWLRTLFHLKLGIWSVIWDLTIGIWDLLPLGSVGVTDNVGKRRHAYLSSLKLQIPMPNSQKNLKFENPKKDNHSIFKLLNSK